MQENAHLPLPALRAFEATARLNSFTKAAEELAMTQAAVSYQVKKLETFLNVTLFRRAGRHIHLTPVGEELAASLSTALATMRSACALASRQGAQRLRITALPTVASNWLVPRLGRFQKTYPGYRIELNSSTDSADLRMGGFDVAVRSGNGVWAGCTSKFLFPNLYTVVTGPEMHDALQAPRDLLALPLFGRLNWWKAWLPAAGVRDDEMAGIASTDLGTQQSEVTAALKQGGAAIVTPGFFADEIASDRLRIPFDLSLEQAGGYWLAYREGASRLPNIKRFRDWILDEARTSPDGRTEG
ncbi:LysR substrate-binding domain-containing protein [Nitratireductor pacificus]|uniref:LysR family transcriptional regulator n=1 Tax=Nitratireductor pacificus pht-3B TaxID=391937 RepID=K2MJX8_9HYPH|nr:LysR substrate-binding domain-containing protein [Nitratireductor pacificus]EKF17507.1 LysR family transcriptional regulator [Nitratireductor pacificus pht-3B]